ncbi:MAG: hemerythrin domain-containing protein [Burkholderiaceae bacterium]
MNTIINKLAPTITNMIRMDHTHVLATFHQYEMDSHPKTKQALVNSLCLTLEIHIELEDEIFYPAMRSVTTNNTVLDKSEPEHDRMRQLIAMLRRTPPTDAGYDQSFMELMQIVMHHVADEETILLPEAELKLKDRLGELGAQMTKRRFQLSAPHAGDIMRNTLRGMPTKSLLLVAGALVAGSYMLKRTGNRRV